MKSSKIIIGSLGLTLVVVVAITMYTPSLDDLFVENPYWNGLSTVYREHDPIRLDSLEQWDTYLVPADNSSMFIIGPDQGFSEADALAVHDYLGDGGRVVLMDDFGSGNQLLELLGVRTRFTGEKLLDPLFFELDHGLPVLLDVKFSGVDEVVLNLPTGLSGEGVVLARSSSFSYLESGEDETELESIPIIMRVNVDGGELIIIGDSSIFINSMIDYRDNRKLLEVLVRDQMFIDESHLLPTRLTRAKEFFRRVHGFFQRAELRYLCIAGLGVLLFKFKWETGEPVEEDDVNRVLMSHPGWSRWQVEQIKKQRMEYGTG